MESSTVSQPRLIGALLVEKNLITSEQLDQALLLQEESGERIGEIMVTEFGVSRLEIAGVLAEQWVDTEAADGKAALKLVEPLTPAEVRLRRPVGEILVEQGLIRKEQLDAALARQSTSGARIGEILVEQGALSRQELETALREQGVPLALPGSPAPVAVDGQPARNGSPVSAVSAQDWSAADRAVVADLEQRLRLIERTTGGTPWQEDLRLVTFDLRAALNAVEERLSSSLIGQASTELTAALEAVSTRIDALENAPALGELDALRLEIEELRTRPVAVEGIDEIRAAVERLEGRPDRAAEISNLANEVGVLATRLDELAGFGELKDMLETVAGQAELTQTGFAELARRVDEIAGIESRLEEMAAHVPGADVVEELRDALAERVTLAGTDALEDQTQRIDRSTLAGNGRVDELGEELSLRISGLAEELGRRLDDADGRADGLVRRDEAAARTAEQAIWVTKELAMRQEWAETRAAAVDSALVAADHAREQGQQELGARVDEAVGAIQADLDAQRAALGEELESSASERAALRARVDTLVEAAAGRAAWEASLTSMLEQRLEGLASRLVEEVAGARADAEQAVGAVRRETGSLGTRIDELQGQRHADAQAARATSERLGERLEEVAGLRADDAEAARAAAADLSARLESLAESVRVEAAGGRTAIENAAGRIDGLHALRVEDLAAAERADAERAARLDDQAVRAAAAVSEVEQALRTELGQIAARLEERDTRASEAREGLRGEFERVASSVGWRLERIEESLASDERWEQLEATVSGLGSRLEEQAAIGHEQVRATEHALRQGLASLGERLSGTEAAYVDAGDALRRSIERLGAAVVEADARIADQVPVSESEGCVAFAPTAAGYRLVELPGRQPEVGSTIEVEGAEGPLVVTRYGRSPLPLDGRACAYLDRA